MPRPCVLIRECNRIAPMADHLESRQDALLHERGRQSPPYKYQAVIQRPGFPWKVILPCENGFFFPPKDSSPFSGRPESQPEKGCGDPGGPGGIILAFVEFSIAYFRHSCYFIIAMIAPPTLTDDFTGCGRGRAGLYFTEQLSSLYIK